MRMSLECWLIFCRGCLEDCVNECVWNKMDKGNIIIKAMIWINMAGVGEKLGLKLGLFLGWVWLIAMMIVKMSIDKEKLAMK